MRFTLLTLIYLAGCSYQRFSGGNSYKHSSYPTSKCTRKTQVYYIYKRSESTVSNHRSVFYVENVEYLCCHHTSFPASLTVALCFWSFCSIALFCSEEKGKLFVPDAEEKNSVIVSSETGKLIDIDIQAVKNAFPIFDASFALV